ncbi:hypothetical protein PQR05_29785 [Paraburkholderia sediminicola]|uniref:hypothetical protein n=1 Tax=Paraburkholderia sediminicola TaxID=458836 RepID=UPI0038BBA2A1
MSYKSKERLAVELDAEMMRVSMRTWRNATDMKMPIHDAFKIHFMRNRRGLLEGFAKTGGAWLNMLNWSAVAQSNEAALEALKAEVKEFVAWAEQGLAELDALKDET